MKCVELNTYSKKNWNNYHTAIYEWAEYVCKSDWFCKKDVQEIWKNSIKKSPTTPFA